METIPLIYVDKMPQKTPTSKCLFSWRYRWLTCNFTNNGAPPQVSFRYLAIINQWDGLFTLTPSRDTDSRQLMKTFQTKKYRPQVFDTRILKAGAFIYTGVICNLIEQFGKKFLFGTSHFIFFDVR